MQGDVVGAGEQRRQVLHAFDVARQPPRCVNGQRRIVAEHVHAQVQRRAGHARAYGSKSHDAERPARNFVPLEAALFLLHQPV